MGLPGWFWLLYPRLASFFLALPLMLIPAMLSHPPLGIAHIRALLVNVYINACDGSIVMEKFR